MNQDIIETAENLLAIILFATGIYFEYGINQALMASGGLILVVNLAQTAIRK